MPKEANSEIMIKSENIKLSNGTLQHIENFPSLFIKPRNVDIWLPEGYSQDKKYAVLYMHDGQMLFDGNSTWNQQNWKIDKHASSLMNKEKVKDFIVVGIWNISNIRWQDYYPEKPYNTFSQDSKNHIVSEFKKSSIDFSNISSDEYLKFMTKELKPYVDTHFSVLTDKDNTYVMGSSMGGLISMYALCEYPEIFGGAACLSTHWIGTFSNENNPIPQTFFNYMETHLPDAQTHKLYFDYGTETLDALYLKYQSKVDELLNNHGYNTNLKFDGHDHSEVSWSNRLKTPLIFLLGKD